MGNSLLIIVIGLLVFIGGKMLAALWGEMDNGLLIMVIGLLGLGGLFCWALFYTAPTRGGRSGMDEDGLDTLILIGLAIVLIIIGGWVMSAPV